MQSKYVDYKTKFVWLIVSGQGIYYSVCMYVFIIFFVAPSSGDIIYLTLAVCWPRNRKICTWLVVFLSFIIHAWRAGNLTGGLKCYERVCKRDGCTHCKSKQAKRDLGFGARRVFLPPVWPPPRLIFFCLVHCMSTAVLLLPLSRPGGVHAQRASAARFSSCKSR